MMKCLVIGHRDGNLGHERQVASNFVAAGPAGAIADIAQVAGTTAGVDADVVANPAHVAAAVQYGIDNGYHFVVYGYGSAYAYVSAWETALAGGLWPVVPQGINAPVQIYPPLRPQAPIYVSGGSGAGSRDRSCGPGLELYTTKAPAGGGSCATCLSYTHATLAGLMAHLREGGLSFWDARAVLRQLDTFPAWTEEEGFGFVGHFTGVPAVDPGLHPPVDVRWEVLGEGAGEDGEDAGRMFVAWMPFETTDYVETVLEASFDGLPPAEIYRGTGSEFLFAPPRSGLWSFEIKSVDGVGGESRAESFTTWSAELYAVAELVYERDDAVVLRRRGVLQRQEAPTGALRRDRRAALVRSGDVPGEGAVARRRERGVLVREGIARRVKVAFVEGGAIHFFEGGEMEFVEGNE